MKLEPEQIALLKRIEKGNHFAANNWEAEMAEKLCDGALPFLRAGSPDDKTGVWCPYYLTVEGKWCLSKQP